MGEMSLTGKSALCSDAYRILFVHTNDYLMCHDDLTNDKTTCTYS